MKFITTASVTLLTLFLLTRSGFAQIGLTPRQSVEIYGKPYKFPDLIFHSHETPAGLVSVDCFATDSYRLLMFFCGDKCVAYDILGVPFDGGESTVKSFAEKYGPKTSWTPTYINEENFSLGVGFISRDKRYFACGRKMGEIFNVCEIAFMRKAGGFTSIRHEDYVSESKSSVTNSSNEPRNYTLNGIKTFLAIRSIPGMNSPEIGRLTPEQRIDTIFITGNAVDYKKETWVPIRAHTDTGDLTGWVRKRYLKAR